MIPHVFEPLPAAEEIAPPLGIHHEQRRRREVVRVNDRLLGRILQVNRRVEQHPVVLFRQLRLVYERFARCRFGFSLGSDPLFGASLVSVEPIGSLPDDWGSALPFGGGTSIDWSRVAW